jgi:hypothetical protein
MHGAAEEERMAFGTPPRLGNSKNIIDIGRSDKDIDPYTLAFIENFH